MRISYGSGDLFAANAMRNTQSHQRYEIGIIGWDPGAHFLLNMADRAFSVAGQDKDPGKVAALRFGSKERAATFKNSSPCFAKHTRWRRLCLRALSSIRSSVSCSCVASESMSSLTAQYSRFKDSQAGTRCLRRRRLPGRLRHPVA
jgi:hypothetical protein